MRKFLAAILSFAMVVGLTGCFGRNVDEIDGLNIVTVIFPEYDFVRAVVGDNANIHMLVGAGSASVHAFEPSPSDLITIENADVFVFTGGEDQAWVDRILGSLENPDMKVVRLLDFVEVLPVGDLHSLADDNEHVGCGVDHSTNEPDHDHDGELDEHVWGSPVNAMILVDELAKIFAEIDEDNAELFRANADEYIAKLQVIHEEIQHVVANSMFDTIVVADKFPFLYFVLEYGLHYAAAFPGCSDQSDPSPRTITFLIETVERLELPYIFHVELSNRNVATAISEHTGAGTLQLNSTQTISREQFNDGWTYADLMRQNIESLKRGLVYEFDNR
jgi:zinc transport system substrate-binding protein